MWYTTASIIRGLSFLIHAGIFCAWMAQDVQRVHPRFGRIVARGMVGLFGLLVVVWFCVLIACFLSGELGGADVANAPLPTAEVWWFVVRASLLLFALSAFIYLMTRRLLFPLFVAWFVVDLVLFVLTGGFLL